MLQFVESRVKTIGAKLLILDASADFCDINEIDRIQVRGAIAILRKIALSLKCGVMLLSHPSVDGMKTKRGYSGSTHWNNSVRSRLYMSTPESEDDEDAELNGHRIIEVPKRNKSAPIKPIHLKYMEGRFIVRQEHQVSQTDRILRAKNIFMELLTEHTRIDYPVSHMPGRNYAPSVFQAHPRNPGLTAGEFRIAMFEMLSDDRAPARIRTSEYGPQSRRRHRIEAL
jgi:RecA-family ATPase